MNWVEAVAQLVSAVRCNTGQVAGILSC